MFQNFTRRHKLDHFESELRYEYVPPPFRYDLYKLVQDNCGGEMSHVREYALYRGASISINADYFQLFTMTTFTNTTVPIFSSICY